MSGQDNRTDAELHEAALAQYDATVEAEAFKMGLDEAAAHAENEKRIQAASDEMFAQLTAGLNDLTPEQAVQDSINECDHGTRLKMDVTGIGAMFEVHGPTPDLVVLTALGVIEVMDAMHVPIEVFVGVLASAWEDRQENGPSAGTFTVPMDDEPEDRDDE